MRLTANQRKMIASLQTSRRRRDERMFVAEGLRSISELAGNFELKYLVVTSEWLERNADRIAGYLPEGLDSGRLLVARNDEMVRMSSMQTPQGVMALFALPSEDFPLEEIETDELVLALDCIQDPGNLGTIVRVADWFGVRKIIASRDTVDLFNPKVIQSTMGAIARVKVMYTDLPAALQQLLEKGMPLYGTFLDGDNLFGAQLSRGGVVVMGNEGNGISDPVGRIIDRRLKIPSFPPDSPTVESLNVGTATAITLGEFRRRQM